MDDHARVEYVVKDVEQRNFAVAICYQQRS